MAILLTVTEGDYFDAFVRLRSKGADRPWLVPSELRPRLVADAATRGSNLTDVALEILAASCGVAFAPNGRKTTPKADDDVILLRLPWDLYIALDSRRRRAGSRRYSLQDEIRAALCEHYGLRYSPLRRTRSPRAAAA